MQHTSQLLMIKPVRFGYNAETAVNNSFQVKSVDKAVQEKALAEFENLIQLLKQHGVEVTVIEDSSEPHTPDSIFPNNWISFHEDGTVYLYPMFAVNRRLERKQEVLDNIRSMFKVDKIIDLTKHEDNTIFLEGTGSMVLDRENKIAYACLSPRTHEKLFHDFCDSLQYRPISFRAVDGENQPIYHTNVMMCVADQYAVICLDAVKDMAERNQLCNSISETGKELIEISFKQMNRFAGNMLQVHNARRKKFVVMSSQAYNSLTALQIEHLEKYNSIIHADISTIEANGGGSARCMMAEVFLPLLSPPSLM